MLGGGPFREERLLTLYTHYFESSNSLDSDHERDRVLQCCRLTSFLEGLYRR